MHGNQLVRNLYERYQARDWSGAAALLHPKAQLQMPATDEHLVGRERVIALQRDYPEPWGELSVVRVVSDSIVTAAEIEIATAAGTFRCAAIWTTQDGLLHGGVEYWITVGGDQAPPDRAVACS